MPLENVFIHPRTAHALICVLQINPNCVLQERNYEFLKRQEIRFSVFVNFIYPPDNYPQDIYPPHPPGHIPPPRIITVVIAAHIRHLISLMHSNIIFNST